MVKGKRKGNTFENKIYKELRQYLSDIKLTIGSGNSEDDADLISNEYVMELKHRKKLDEAQLNHFFQKVFQQATLYDKTPILIYKENYKPIKVMTFAHLKDYTIIATMDYEEWKTTL